MDIPMDSCDCSWKIMSMDIIALKILLEIAMIASKTLVDGWKLRFTLLVNVFVFFKYGSSLISLIASGLQLPIEKIKTQ